MYTGRTRWYNNDLENRYLRKIFTDAKRRAASLRQLSFLYKFHMAVRRDERGP